MKYTINELFMQFQNNQIYHIYNQGNNRQTVYFSDENYKYFLWKMRAYLLPFGDMIAYCLMPNHFHWLFYVRQTEIKREILRSHVNYIENMRRKDKYGRDAKIVTNDNSSYISKSEMINLNEAIGIIERTYTQAINKELDRSGSLFRKECKAKDGWIDDFVTIEYSDIKRYNNFKKSTDYLYNCFNYIHNNPVSANLTVKDIDWEYSSAQEYAGLRTGLLCNIELGKELMGIDSIQT
ncbi:MAG: hypothetical protein R2771_04020 [Saprospiraceae bacterium]